MFITFFSFVFAAAALYCAVGVGNAVFYKTIDRAIAIKSGYLRSFIYLSGIIIATISVSATVMIFFGAPLLVFFVASSVSASAWTKIGLALFSAICGLAAYSLRCRARLFYGTMETSFGIATAYLSISTPDGAQLVAFLAATYIVVRGLDNIEKGLKDRPNIRVLWLKLFGPQV